ncbi:MAG TPA: hypothetical protein VFG45_06910 [Candidatus Nitrosocosmicus sp.]|jgi:hypothetical protein|uniref:hypothetical protein n=1 Tax=Candidatus Nitrosocosmicus agrestis TaxID=2563600 RepID=UPI00122E6357|nr:hypothetical protein [Candidatus Nitrosocosmicus sp. SS]KAA2281248.1 hypothetical protein F1Z66_09010 [Candidatus Nitrosocosmicus sp. SS]KAF0867960.1 hypothetical protein E5N71_12685 [Candidatus Nitrosocosmicus sp. SS]MDR4490525.1 hypothetical protein [Candidatus Nitrosocosmicus sp.]HET6589875.1 hypothetical protein [Candidatus Nitrosocosmicus sp.]
MECRICSHPIVMSRLKRVRLDNNKEIFYDILFDICNSCNGPIIGVKRYDRQNSNVSYSQNPEEWSSNDIEFYSKSNN